MKKIKFAALSAVVAMGLFTVSCGSAQKTTENADAQPTLEEVGDAMAQAENVGSVAELSAGDVIAANPTIPVVIDFNATWCGPCQQFKPIFHKVAEDYAGKATFVSVDVDQCPALKEQFEVSSIPQITVVRPDGTKVTTIGMMPEADFVKWLDEAIK